MRAHFIPSATLDGPDDRIAIPADFSGPLHSVAGRQDETIPSHNERRRKIKLCHLFKKERIYKNITQEDAIKIQGELYMHNKRHF